MLACCQQLARQTGARSVVRAVVAQPGRRTLFGLFKPRFHEGGFDDVISKKEAALILGCKETTPRKEVLARYKKLMVLNHPDQGGSAYLATKINEAKEALLKRS